MLAPEEASTLWAPTRESTLNLVEGGSNTLCVCTPPLSLVDVGLNLDDDVNMQHV